MFEAEMLGTALSAIGDFLPKLGSGLSDLITGISRLLEGDFSGALSSLGSGISTIVTALVNFNVDIFKGFVDTLLSLVGVDLSAIAANAQEIGGNLINGIVQGFAEFTDDPLGWLTSNLIEPLGTAMIDAAGDVYQGALDLGGNILNGIIDALESLAAKIMSAIMGAIPAGIDLGVLGTINIGGSGPMIGGGEKTSTGSPVLDEWFRTQTGVIPGAARGKAHARAGSPLIVGERGMEVFVPQTAGRIVPNNQLGSGAGGGNAYNLSGATINLPGVTNARQFLSELEKEAKRQNKRLTTNRGSAW
jgi:hypothetical protein